MKLTTTEEVQQYLHSRKIPTTTIAPITGGTSNYTWRLTNPDGQTSIFKHAEPHLSANPSSPFPLERMTFEVHALETIPQLIPPDNTIRYPKTLFHDAENHVLILSDVGQKTLKDMYTDPRLDIHFIGRRIGQWLANLHTSTTAHEVRSKFSHTTAKRMYRWNYNSLPTTFSKFGYDAALAERINADFGSLLDTDDTCVCHTDMWPGNILFDVKDENWFQGPQMAVIDWEVARRGNGVTDVGHFAGEAWFLDRFCGGRGLLGAFLEGYVQGRELEFWDRKRVVVQFGTHVVHWGNVYGWIDDERTIEAVKYGVEVLRRVDEENWGWFEDGELAPLFRC